MNSLMVDLWTVIQALGPAIAVYVGVKVDLAVAHANAKAAKESADEAHKRIDTLMMKGK